MLRRIAIYLSFITLILIPTGAILAAPIPTVTLDLPATGKLGESITFSVTFDNTHPNDIGYGPIVDLWIPSRGADGNDGITFTSASYLTGQVNAITQTFPGGGCLDHPYLRDTQSRAIQVCGTPGDTLVVLELPFGSFTPAQPAAEVTIDAVISPNADLNQPLQVQARGAFRFGISPVDDPCCDPAVIGTPVRDTITPVLIEMEKDNNAPEYEVVPGPNFSYRWTVTGDIAEGETITNLRVEDQYPSQVVVTNVVVFPASGTVVQTTPTLIVDFPTVNGVDDFVIAFDFNLPASTFLDASGTVEPLPNLATASGDWTPNDPNDGAINGGTIATGGCPPSQPCPGGAAPTVMALAVQKIALPVAAIQPGNEIEYRLAFQVSDYFAFQSTTITDALSDGQRFIPGSATLTMTLQGVAQAPQAIVPTVTEYFTGGAPGMPAPAPYTAGDTVLTFAIAPTLIGGCIPTGGGAFNCAAQPGGTFGIITFRAQIQEEFSDLHNVGGNSGDASVDQGDILGNSAVISADRLNPGNLAPAGAPAIPNDTETETIVPRGQPIKSLYALNGVVCPCPDPTIVAGDTVTYRITYDLPNSDFENLRLVDFLPLPVFRANEVQQFDHVFNAAPPAAGRAHFHPDDTLYNTIIAVTPVPPRPDVTTNAGANSVTFRYGSFDLSPAQDAVADILFTVTVTDRPFADELRLTNLVRALEGSTNAGEDSEDAIVQIELTAPILVMRKGAVATSSVTGVFDPVTPGPVAFNPPGSPTPFNGVISSDGLATAPINSDLSGVERGDRVTFAIVIENLGNGRKGAFDIRIRDEVTPGFSIPANGLNLQVRLGNGTPVTYTGSEADFFGNGIELIDPNLDTGACGPYNGVSGTNIVVITYDLQLDSKPSESLINTATTTNYSGSEGGADVTGGQDLVDTATIRVTGADSSDGTAGNQGNAFIRKTVDQPFARPGDRVVWRVSVTNPESAPLADVSVTDTLPEGLIVLNVETSRGTVSFAGLNYTFSLGTLGSGETVSIVFTTQIVGTINVPFRLINTAIVSAGGIERGRATADVAYVARLADTGESPWRDVRPVLLGAVIVVLGAALWVIGRR
ncbi:MAG: DUF11 domain-containing protein [Anaerolineae bacterium]|nr:DUF11 domain-containing protein [Anaerolineae bacterium]